jgi:gamma-glutamyltranspeptidase/glutathione hydrolase
MLGSGGSNRIRTAILQVIVQLIDRGRAIEPATLCPRIHLEGDLLNVEGGIDERVVDELLLRFPRSNRFDGYSFFFGGVHSVVSRGGVFEGAGDPRRAGVFLRCE